MPGEWKEKISKTTKGRNKSPEHKEKIRKGAMKNIALNRENNSGEKNPFFGKKHSPESLLKMRGRKWSAEARHSFSVKRARELSLGKVPLTRGQKNWYVSTKTGEANYADSNYELQRMKFLDSSPQVEFWTKNHGIRLEWGDQHKNYVPDFLVRLSNGSVYLEELKGWVRDETEFQLKNEAAQRYAQENNMIFRVLFGDSLEVL